MVKFGYIIIKWKGSSSAMSDSLRPPMDCSLPGSSVHEKGLSKAMMFKVQSLDLVILMRQGGPALQEQSISYLGEGRSSPVLKRHLPCWHGDHRSSQSPPVRHCPLLLPFPPNRYLCPLLPNHRPGQLSQVRPYTHRLGPHSACPHGPRALTRCPHIWPAWERPRSQPWEACMFPPGVL